MKVAILVDGGFYRKRANYLFGNATPQDRASQLYNYCRLHIKSQENAELYRVLYYDCMPLDMDVFHPYKKQNITLRRNETYKWSIDFFNALKGKRKFALRMGQISEVSAEYRLKNSVTKNLFSQKISLDDITESDFEFRAEQKGVDMKIGLDIASLAYKKLVDQIILISGDSDFVPAAKLARREGIDFVLDPMWAKVKADLNEHIDGLRSQCKNEIKRQDIVVEALDDSANSIP
mgnify:CR=1 FL=1